MTEIALQTPIFTPDNDVQPGDTVRLGLRVQNKQPNEIAGAQLRVDLSPALSPVLGSFEVNGAFRPGDDALLVSHGSCRLPALAPGEELELSFNARVATTTSGNTVDAAAVVTLCDGQELRSEKAVLRIKAQPSFRCTGSFEQIAPTADLEDRNCLKLQYVVTNVGSGRADNVQVRVELPDSCSSPDGRRTLLSGVVSIAPHEEATLDFPVLFDERIAGDIVVVENVDILLDGSFFTAAPAIEVKVPASVALDDTTFSVTPSENVVHGDVVKVQLSVKNRGRGAALNVPVTFIMPAGVNYIGGSAALGGRPVNEQSVDGGICRIIIPRVPGGSSAVVTAKCIVQRAIDDESALTFIAEIDRRTFTAHASGRAIATFDKDQNYIEADRAVASPYEKMPFSVVVMNTGNVPAPISLRAESSYVAWAADAGAPRINYDPKTQQLSKIVDLAPLAPGAQRRIQGETMTPLFMDEEAKFEVPIFIKVGDEDESLLGYHTIYGRMSVRFEGSRILDSSSEPIRFGQRRALTFLVVNTGSTIARDVKVELSIPNDLVVETAYGAQHADAVLHFGDIAAGGTASATLRVRFDGHPNGTEKRAIAGRVIAKRGESLALDPLALSVFAEASIVDPVVRIIGSDPSEPCNVEVRFRNAGDGKAGRVQLQTNDLEGYIGQSTTIFGQPISDIAGQSPLARGIGIDNLFPGEEVHLGWRFYPSIAKAIQIGVNFHIDDGERFLVRSQLFTPVSRILAGGISFDEGAPTTIDVEKLLTRAGDAEATISVTDAPMEIAEGPPAEFAPAGTAGETMSVPRAPWAVGTEEAATAAATPSAEFVPSGPRELTPITDDRSQDVASAVEPVADEHFPTDETSQVDEEDEGDVTPQAAATVDALSEIIGFTSQPSWQPVSVEEASAEATPAAAVSVSEPTTEEQHHDEISVAPAEAAPTIASDLPWWAQIEQTTESPVSTPTVGKTDAQVSLQKAFTRARAAVLLRSLSHLLNAKRAGWYRHVMAVKLLLADDVVSNSDELTEARATYHRFYRQALVGLGDARFELSLPSFAPTDTWVASMEDDKTAEAFFAALEALSPIAGVDAVTPDIRHDLLTATLSKSEADRALETRRSVSSLYAHLPVFIAKYGSDDELSKLLGLYSQSYHDFFHELEHESPASVRETMLMDNALLDDYLAQIITCLSETVKEEAA